METEKIDLIRIIPACSVVMVYAGINDMHMLYMVFLAMKVAAVWILIKYW